MNRDAYSFTLTGLEIMEGGGDLLRREQIALARRSGFLSCSSARSRNLETLDQDLLATEIYFDSSAWTGRACANS